MKLLQFNRRTKIVATLGPASASASVLGRLVRAGVDVARLNLSHGTVEEHARTVRLVREAASHAERPVAILVDVPGPKYRVGPMAGESVVLRRGASVTLTTEGVVGTESRIGVNLPTFAQDAAQARVVLLDDGAIELRVVEVKPPDVVCRVVAGGTLKPGKGVVFPGVPLSIPFLTDATRAALDFAAEQRADWVALSFVSGPEDIRQARDALRERGATIPLIAKIEMRQAVERLDAILREADGVMVARGDLGLEMPVQKIPHVQKGIIRAANRLGKPVITATQMLESMILAPRPTRAEVTDVANAILDGTDAVMLSGETSVGQYPVQTVRMMEKIARETEKSFPFEQVAEERRREVGDAIDDAIAHDACHTAGIVGARAIVAFTTSGSTALRVARYRPRTPLLALTSREDVRRRLALVWGVHPVVVAEQSSADEVFATASRCARELGLARPGDVLVITAGVPLGVSGSTNLLKVHTVAGDKA